MKLKVRVYPVNRDSANLLLTEIFVSIAVRAGTMEKVTGCLGHSVNNVSLNGYVMSCTLLNSAKIQGV